MPKKIADDQKPWVGNYPPLKAWLVLHGARCMWQEMKPHQSVERWQFPNGDSCIIVVFSERHGWDVFTSSHARDIPTTLADAEARLRLVPKKEG